MSLVRAQQEISSAEFSQWIAYNNVEPFGESRADLRAGIISSVMANIHRGKGQKSFTADEFMPEFGEREKPKMKSRQMQGLLRQFVKMHNATTDEGK